MFEKSTAPTTNEEMSFEAAFAQLGTVVKALESDELALERAVELYETGVELVRLCNARLDGAELRIQELSVSSSGEPTLIERGLPEEDR